MAPDNDELKQSKKSCLACGAQLPPNLTVCPKDGTYLVGGSGETLLGTTLAERYEILSVIGEGGMGVVYKARHLLMNRMVAIKTLHQHLASNQKTTQRFKREATLISDLEHPNIITVYDFGVTPKGQPYLVLGYLEGRGLDEVIKSEGLLSQERAIKIFSQVCDGLAHAHARGIIHRDLKPSNIMLTDGEQGSDMVKIVDFGIAKVLPESGKDPLYLTQAGETFGSPLYMSPEQCLGRHVDHRSDIYSMGCLMYECLTGMPPHLGESSFITFSKHVSELPQPFPADLGIPAQLEAVVLKALAKEPEARQQSARELASELERAMRQL